MNKVKVKDTQVELLETEKCVEVQITTESADIYVNGVCVWSPYDNPLYALIPPAFRKFVKEHDDGFMEQNEEKDQLTVDVRLFDECIALYFQKNQTHKITARFDCITTIDELVEEFIGNNMYIGKRKEKELTVQVKTAWKELETFISEETKFRFHYSHSMNDRFFGYWDIIFAPQDWNEALFIEVAKRIRSFNLLVGGMANKYHF